MESMDMIHNRVSHVANIYCGHVIDPGMPGKVKVTVIATGFPPKRKGLITDKKPKNERGTQKNEGDERMTPAYTWMKMSKLK
jgi:cell division GTPase FtsZ